MNLESIHKEGIKAKCSKLQSIELIGITVNTGLAILAKQGVLKNLKVLKLFDCKLYGFDEFCNVAESKCPCLSTVQISACEIREKDFESFLQLQKGCTSFTLTNLKNKLTSNNRCKASTLSVKGDDFDMLFPIINPNLYYLNLSNCGLDNAMNRLVINYCIGCQKDIASNLRYVSLRNNKIRSLNIYKLSEDDEATLDLVIDYRGNKLSAMLNKAASDYFAECTLLLWDNYFEGKI